jgi:Mor family transcriptional regulator
MERLMEVLYAGKSLQRKTFEKRERNAEIYRRYVAGEDSVVLRRAYGLSDRRIRDIIEKERKKKIQSNISSSRSYS